MNNRYFLACKACQERWVEEAAGPDDVGRDHRCEYLADLEARGLTPSPDLWFDAEPLKVSAGKKHTCDDACTHAIGHLCRCECGGTNHGIGHLYPNVKTA